VADFGSSSNPLVARLQGSEFEAVRLAAVLILEEAHRLGPIEHLALWRAVHERVRVSGETVERAFNSLVDRDLLKWEVDGMVTATAPDAL